MTKGKVKWYNEAKGFGFIASENGDDVYVHRNNLNDRYLELQPEQEVVFDIRQGEKGPAAYNVRAAE
jgi:cold shock protein